MSEQSVKGLMSEGNIWKQLLFFSIPLVLGNIFQQLYNAVDSIIVGNFVGSQALAAVTSSSPVINMLISFFMGLSIGAGVVISRYFGANDRQGVSDSIHTSMAIIHSGRYRHDLYRRLADTIYPAMGRRTTGCDE